MPLLNFVTALLGGGRPDRATGLSPRPPPPARDPWVLARATRIATLLPDLTRDETEAMIFRPIQAFTARVHDLGASERHHHRESFGLRDHSFEVAEYALRVALSEAFAPHVAPNPEDQEFRIPRLRYAAFFFGLLHDVGKILGLRVQADREIWNPLAEPLQEFMLRHRRGPATVLWKADRGYHAHNSVRHFLFGLFHTREMVDYLGAPLLAELFEGTSAAARGLAKIIEDADRRSTREYEAREARASRAGQESEEAVFSGPPVDYADLVPKAFLEALRESIFALNTVDGDLMVGSHFVAFRYPDAMTKLAGFVRERMGPLSQKARQLQTGEGGARDLAHHLAEHQALFQDAATGGWKVQMAVSVGGAFDATSGVLIRKEFLIPGEMTRSGLPLFEGGLTLRRPNDHVLLAVPGFRAASTPDVTIPAPGATPPPPVPAQRPRVSAQGAAPLPHPVTPVPALAAPPPPGVRTVLTPDLLLEDLREAILSGWITTNQWNGQVYVLPDATYMVTPAVFRRLVERGLYSIDPSRDSNDYLNTLARCDCVRQHGAGRVVTRMTLRRNARKPCAVFIVETHGFFRTQEEINRVGFWTESEILEDEGGNVPMESPATGVEVHDG